MPRHLRAHSPANQSEGYPSKFGLLPLDEPIRREHSSEPGMKSRTAVQSKKANERTLAKLFLHFQRRLKELSTRLTMNLQASVGLSTSRLKTKPTLPRYQINSFIGHKDRCCESCLTDILAVASLINRNEQLGHAALMD